MIYVSLLLFLLHRTIIRLLVKSIVDSLKLLRNNNKKLIELIELIEREIIERNFT